MNESALEGFVKIVEMNSFSAAADALYISQSALSQQIRTLEGQLKLELFQHVPRRVVLTPAGQDFYPQAKMILNLYQNAVKHAQAVQQHTDPPERHILIAYCHEALRMFGYDLFALTGELCIRFRRCSDVVCAAVTSGTLCKRGMQIFPFSWTVQRSTHRGWHLRRFFMCRSSVSHFMHRKICQKAGSRWSRRCNTVGCRPITWIRASMNRRCSGREPVGARRSSGWGCHGAHSIR